MSIGRFYAGIGVLIWDPKSSKYLILKRSDEKDFAPGYWECVTGRVDQGEGFVEAAHREVREELNVSVDLIEILGTTHFYRGEKRPDFELIGVVFLGVIGTPENIQISAEHSEYQWVTTAEVKAILRSEADSEGWLARVIDRAETIIVNQPAAVFEINRRSGFELDS
jgi:8-oxo-dGTP pyrophosphatase MutT (NUDIX family)